MTLVYPVHWGVVIRGAHGSYRAPALCSALSGFCLQFSKLFFRYFAEEEKKSAKRKINTAIREISVKKRKKKQLIRAVIIGDFFP